MSVNPEADFDLEKLFLPAWAQETPAANRFANYRGDEESRGERPGREGRGPRRDFGGPPRGDGPRGPRRVAKPGVAILSVRSQTPILPCVFIARPAWRLHSWDKTAVPKPFSTVIAAYGEPILPQSVRTRGVLEATRLQVEQVLNKIHADLDESSEA